MCRRTAIQAATLQDTSKIVILDCQRTGTIPEPKRPRNPNRRGALLPSTYGSTNSSGLDRSLAQCLVEMVLTLYSRHHSMDNAMIALFIFVDLFFILVFPLLFEWNQR